MRPSLCTLITACWLLASCTSGEDDGVTQNDDTPKNEKTYILELSALRDTVSNIYAWQGNLDGRYPVLIWYKEFGDMLKGSLFYTENKHPKPVNILGTIEGGKYRILEMWPDGDISGVWELEPDAHGAEGTWAAPVGNETYNASLMRTDTAVTIADVNTKAGVSGLYKFSYGKTGAQGQMNVTHKAGTVVVSLETISPAPARNTVSVKAKELPLKNNEAIYHPDTRQDCSMRIRFFKGFAVVDFIDGKGGCDTGNYAGVKGIYIKTS